MGTASIRVILPIKVLTISSETNSLLIVNQSGYPPGFKIKNKNTGSAAPA